jgi:hypothetical protein
MTEHWTDADESRIDIIGQNGNDGAAYDAPRFTPGPWRASEANDGYWVYLGAGAHAGSGLNAIYMGKDAATAKLIAAAPDLYLALEIIVEQLKPDYDSDAFQHPEKIALDTARQALKRARGEV